MHSKCPLVLSTRRAGLRLQAENRSGFHVDRILQDHPKIKSTRLSYYKKYREHRTHTHQFDLPVFREKSVCNYDYSPTCKEAVPGSLVECRTVGSVYFGIVLKDTCDGVQVLCLEGATRLLPYSSLVLVISSLSTNSSPAGTENSRVLHDLRSFVDVALDLTQKIQPFIEAVYAHTCHQTKYSAVDWHFARSFVHHRLVLKRTAINQSALSLAVWLLLHGEYMSQFVSLLDRSQTPGPVAVSVPVDLMDSTVINQSVDNPIAHKSLLCTPTSLPSVPVRKSPIVHGSTWLAPVVVVPGQLGLSFESDNQHQRLTIHIPDMSALIHDDNAFVQGRFRVKTVYDWSKQKWNHLLQDRSKHAWANKQRPVTCLSLTISGPPNQSIVEWIDEHSLTSVQARITQIQQYQHVQPDCFSNTAGELATESMCILHAFSQRVKELRKHRLCNGAVLNQPLTSLAYLFETERPFLIGGKLCRFTFGDLLLEEICLESRVLAGVLGSLFCTLNRIPVRYLCQEKDDSRVPSRPSHVPEGLLLSVNASCLAALPVFKQELYSHVKGPHAGMGVPESWGYVDLASPSDDLTHAMVQNDIFQFILGTGTKRSSRQTFPRDQSRLVDHFYHRIRRHSVLEWIEQQQCLNYKHTPSLWCLVLDPPQESRAGTRSGYCPEIGLKVDVEVMSADMPQAAELKQARVIHVDSCMSKLLLRM